MPSSDQTAETRARLLALVADLQMLPERQRAALVMRELSGLTHEEIACALGMSVGAAKQAVFEARRSLMEFAEGRAMLCDEIQRIVSDGDASARISERRQRLPARERNLGGHHVLRRKPNLRERRSGERGTQRRWGESRGGPWVALGRPEREPVS